MSKRYHHINKKLNLLTTHHSRLMRLAVLWGVMFFFALTARAQSPALQKGKQSFSFSSLLLRLPAPVNVWMYSPSSRPDTLPIVIMLHGAERNASGYIDQWAPVADLYQLVVIAPTFDKENFKGSDRYNLGNVWNESSERFINSKEWTFSVIEPLFDEVVKALGSQQTGYYLSGHSAGAQFVHRFLYFVPNNRAVKVFIANAGWYTLPDLTTDYPFGVKNVPNIGAALKEFISKPTLLALGEADIDTTSANFQKGPPYNAQGANRFERGKNFFKVVQAAAVSQQRSLNWTMVSLPGVAHSNAETAKQAGAFFRSVHYPMSIHK